MRKLEFQNSQSQPQTRWQVHMLWEMNAKSTYSNVAAFPGLALDCCIKTAQTSFKSHCKWIHWNIWVHEEQRLEDINTSERLEDMGNTGGEHFTVCSIIGTTIKRHQGAESDVLMQDHRKRTLSFFFLKCTPAVCQFSKHGCHRDTFAIAGCLTSTCSCVWNGFMVPTLCIWSAFRSKWQPDLTLPIQNMNNGLYSCWWEVCEKYVILESITDDLLSLIWRF